uniref:Uncharacterized protein n=1 Tax=Arundo donax TaxID=35708 RepID=A0A0A9EWI7_ARUDO
MWEAAICGFLTFMSVHSPGSCMQLLDSCLEEIEYYLD